MFSLFLTPVSYFSGCPIFSFCIYSGKGEGSKSRATRAGSHKGWIFVLLSHRVNKCPCSNTFSQFPSQGLCRARIPLHSHTPGLSSLSSAAGLAPQRFPLLFLIPRHPKPTQSPPGAELALKQGQSHCWGFLGRAGPGQQDFLCWDGSALPPTP